MNKANPVCGTCRRKSRRCDRGKPSCQRCISKGLLCEGYETKFKVYDVAKGPKKRRVAEQSKVNTVGKAKERLWSLKRSSSLYRPPGRDRIDIILCEALVVVRDPRLNPFRRYVLPLAHQDASLLHAILGLSACHIPASEFLEHSFLLKEEFLGLIETEEDLTLSIILLLLLQDICETGTSSHGTHLNGVAFLCSRIASRKSAQNQLRNFLVSSLACLQIMIGCPTEIFLVHSEVLCGGKAWLAGQLHPVAFQRRLEALEQQLRDFDVTTADYPSDDPSWASLAEAFRHATLLRIARFPNSFSIPCDADLIKSSVSAILDTAASIPVDSAIYKRLVFPLFMAAVETSSKHQLHYARICLENCRKATEIKQPAMCNILDKVWDVRQITDGKRNVPWMEYTCSARLQRQHDYLCL
ncbi:hypothetical protein EJ05DRAFT_493356 [Pseudovirgaria hyperparasitica]|uniref:Zn(2)-C6 fungal-type domain-containing protein n=1 Tax=Pseudovirgaria hyperparasitica TaxID=470096 RepID=A0A6A6W6H1_9PEZI|nr:uncharacterized protein EJ05DRAFT_493356 [Pseudovirgaria hyperparasitica]KAF2757789.1 hypothetical protein EJ05DRAFT_493356 [Pseudovirgaria hyperparasitica]